MAWPFAQRIPVVSLALVACGLVVAGWQVGEHRRYERTSREDLIKRGRDITSTLGVVLRSQRRYGLLVVKERIEPSLQALVQSEKLVSIAILPASGEPLASAGRPIDLTLQDMQAGGVYWGRHTLTMMNLMDLGSGGSESGPLGSETIVMSDEERRWMRPGARGAQGGSAEAAAEPAAGPPSAPAFHPTFGRPFWMTGEQYDAVIQQKGVHSLVICLSTDEMHSSLVNDLILRSLVAVLALGGGLVSGLAWRNFERTSDLELRLVKTREMNAYLKEMNLGAAGLAHETRNPLNLIRGLAQMVAMETEALPHLRGHALAIVEEADRVTAQLNDFIAYSKPREVHPAPVEVRRLVADLGRTLLPDIEEKKVSLHGPEAPCVIEADEQLLRQALFNVLLNALQAVGPGGQIRVRIQPVDSHEAVLEVADDGPGVPADQRQAIFKPYVTMREKGVGLGLAIVHQIAAAHRWEVTCAANEPRGALFRFSGLRLIAPRP